MGPLYPSYYLVQIVLFGLVFGFYVFTITTPTF